MNLTRRDKLVLFKSLHMLLWLGVIFWTLAFSSWLALAVSVFVTLDRTVFRRILILKGASRASSFSRPPLFSEDAI